MSTSAAQLTPQQLQQLNMAARSLIHQKAVRMQQQIFSQSGINPANTPAITVLPRNVGLVLGFYVQVLAQVNNTGASGPAITPTDFGPANLVQNFSFNDLENNNRINTPGWHVAMVNSVTARRIYGSSLVAVTGEDSPMGFGNVYAPIAAPSVPFGTNAQWSMWYWVPLSYSESDLRGAIYMNVVNANAQLNIGFNQLPFAAAPANDTLYVGVGNTGTLTNITVNVHQVYYDQLPRGQNGGVILPTIDLSTVYELKQTVYTGISAGQDYPVNYSNFRDFLSTVAIYYNGAARTAGTDINYWSLQSANFTNIWKQPPSLISVKTRNHLGVDVPKGCYYFGSRSKPIATVQFGNMQLVLNASTAGASASLLLGYEDFALKNAVTQAGSINAGSA
jgi:P3 major capsid protein